MQGGEPIQEGRSKKARRCCSGFPVPCRVLRAACVRRRRPAGELEAPAKDTLGIGRGRIEGLDEKDRFGSALQGGRHCRMHDRAKRAMIGGQIRLALMGAGGMLRQLMPVAGLHGAHHRNQQNPEHSNPSQPARVLGRVDSGLEHIVHD